MLGEHIRARRNGRWTHAIDCGDETVVHLDGDAGKAQVRRSYRPEFVAGAEVVQVVTHRERTFPPSEVVARAYSRIGDPALAAMFRDSEAFADWCATGRHATGPATVVPQAPADLPPPDVITPAAGLAQAAAGKPKPRRRKAARKPAPRPREVRASAKKRGSAGKSARRRKAAGRGARGKGRPR